MPPKRITPASVGADDTSHSQVDTKKKKEELSDLEKANLEIERLKKELEESKKTPPAQAPQAPGNRVDLSQEKENITQVIKTQKQLLVEKLNKQPQVQVMIPLGIGEKPGVATHEVGINGVVFVFPKGKMIMVPETVAKLIADHFNVTFAAGEEFRADRDKDTQDALT